MKRNRTYESNEPGVDVFNKTGINKKLNNMLGFDDFEKTFEPKKQKSTKRTDVGLDIINEMIETDNIDDVRTFLKRIDPLNFTDETMEGKNVKTLLAWALRHLLNEIQHKSEAQSQNLYRKLLDNNIENIKWNVEGMFRQAFQFNSDLNNFDYYLNR
jgi:hypothetical protein